MTKEQSLFEAALEIADSAARESFLDQSCVGDLRLHERVVKLLAAHAKSDRLFSPGLADFVTGALDLLTTSALADGAPAGAEKIGSRVGRYRILELLGEGGCGQVYLAEQEEPVRRRVALKIIKLGMDTQSVIARFEAERQALALMDHPHIAKVLDAGATESGLPYFVMELVRGVRITNYCDEHHLDTQQRLNLFIQVCQAIQHAHQKGVVHRDIKPSNILVAVNNDHPIPKVIDFGIAKATEGKLTDNPAFTFLGQFIGTPAYMSPEQAEMSGLDVDTRSDIYSLGVLLYELLTGRTPFDQNELANSGFDEMRRTLIEDEPKNPSTMLTSLTHTELTATAQRHHLEPPKLIKSVKGDLDWIVMKALEKDRARRYETANGLAMDIQRYLDNEPIAARPPSQFYRLQKLVRRNKLVFTSVAIVAVTLLVGFGTSTFFYFREREALKIQARLLQEAEAREKVTHATVLVSHGQMQAADDLVAQVPAELYSPSTEAAQVFRQLGLWNTLHEKWRPAADRYSVLVEVNQADKSDQTDKATFDLLFAAPLLIEAGDLTAYDHIRRMEIDHLTGTTNRTAAEQLLKTTLLAPADADILNKLTPFATLLTNSLKAKEQDIQANAFDPAWRAFALGLFEYRRGNFASATNYLGKSISCSEQDPSCTAMAHILLGMASAELGNTDMAPMELQVGRGMVAERFQQELKLGDEKSGMLHGWLTARILLRESENRATPRRQ